MVKKKRADKLKPRAQSLTQPQIQTQPSYLADIKEKQAQSSGPISESVPQASSYQYVISDLKRSIVIAGIIMILLIAIYFLLR